MIYETQMKKSIDLIEDGFAEKVKWTPILKAFCGLSFGRIETALEGLTVRELDTLISTCNEVKVDSKKRTLQQLQTQLKAAGLSEEDFLDYITSSENTSFEAEKRKAKLEKESPKTNVNKNSIQENFQPNTKKKNVNSFKLKKTKTGRINYIATFGKSAMEILVDCLEGKFSFSLPMNKTKFLDLIDEHPLYHIFKDEFPKAFSQTFWEFNAKMKKDIEFIERVEAAVGRELVAPSIKNQLLPIEQVAEKIKAEAIAEASKAKAEMVEENGTQPPAKSKEDRIESRLTSFAELSALIPQNRKTDEDHEEEHIEEDEVNYNR